MPVVLHRAHSRTVPHKSVFATRHAGSSHAGPPKLGSKMSAHKVEEHKGARIKVRYGGRKGRK